MRADHANPTERLDRFAELISQDIDIPDIMLRMGLSHGGAYALMAKLRREFGWQAK